MSDPLINLEAEAELLGSLLLHNDQIDPVADILSSEDFVEPAHHIIYTAIVQQASQGKAVKPHTIRGFVENDSHVETLGGLPYLARLTGACTGLVTFDTARLLVDLSNRRRMRAGLGTAATACTDLESTMSEIVAHADSALDASKDQIHQPTGGECFDELIAGFDDNQLGVTSGLIPELDKVLGPMRPKDLIIGAGRPGMGKTAVALSYSLGAARNGHGVLFVSLEMSSRQLAARMAADLCYQAGHNVQFSAIRDATLNADERRRVADAGRYMHSLPFQVVDAGNLTIGRLNTLIRRHARRMAAKGHSLELVVVDYLQLLSPDARGRSNYEAVSEVSRSLKAMAKDHGVAVFALAQLSREVEKRTDKSPQLSDLRDSGQIEQDADAVLFLLRKEYYVRKEEPAEGSTDYRDWQIALQKVQGQIEFIVAKRRNGVEGRAFGTFYGAFQAVR